MGLFAKITGRKANTAEGVPYSKCTEIIAVLGDDRDVELCVGGVTVRIPRHLRSLLERAFDSCPRRRQFLSTSVHHSHGATAEDERLRGDDHAVLVVAD